MEVGSWSRRRTFPGHRQAGEASSRASNRVLVSLDHDTFPRRCSSNGPVRLSEQRLIATYQTRVRCYAAVERADGDGALDAYAELFGQVERRLFAEVAADRSAASLKSQYLKRYGIPARMFNGVRVSLEGKVASIKEQQKLLLDSLSRRLRVPRCR